MMNSGEKADRKDDLKLEIPILPSRNPVEISKSEKQYSLLFENSSDGTSNKVGT
jgi:hypothetical protein